MRRRVDLCGRTGCHHEPTFRVEWRQGALLLVFFRCGHHVRAFIKAHPGASAARIAWCT